MKGVKGEVVAVSAHRERFSFDASEPWRAWVMPGKYRITLDADVEGGTARFLPYATDIASGQTHDLTPRGPWSLTLYQKKKDRQQQLWLAVVDAGGRILHRSPGEPGRLRALSGQSVKIDQELSSFAWIEAERFVGVDLGKLQYETRIPFGDDEIRGLAELDQLRVFNAAGSSAKAPEQVEDHTERDFRVNSGSPPNPVDSEAIRPPAAPRSSGRARRRPLPPSAWSSPGSRP